MADYHAPTGEQLFVLETVAGLESLSALPGFGDATPELAGQILEESARLAEQGFAPLNMIGDREGARLSEGRVTLPAGFAEAYRDYVEAGWNGLSADPAHGGQGLPFVLSVAVQEQFTAANMAFSLCPMLTLSAIEALQAHGDAAMKALYLPHLVSGHWAGTMLLTEPQAGSDVGALRTSATPTDDGTYRLRGQKIFITWGEHDLAENIIHFVLARLPDAPAGSKGISLFLVPKYLPDADGKPGIRNDIRCIALEHKMGIHASPTCTMALGEEGACVGWLIGQPHGGMAAMFTMMNHARINVGNQGVAIAERAWQDARAYAAERVQFGPIIGHADVRRMLMTMHSLTQAARAIVYANAAAVDRAHSEPDPETRAYWKRRADLLTPISKAWATDVGIEVSSLAIQVHGGAGFIEETGVAQHYRDARIAAIYEGTNGIQAMDLAGRKLRLDNGKAMAELESAIRRDIDDWRDQEARQAMTVALERLAQAREAMLAHDSAGVGAAASPFLALCGAVAGGWLLGLQAEEAERRLVAGQADQGMLKSKRAAATFFLRQRLPVALAQIEAVRASPSQLLTGSDFPSA
ncbi:acyl-CoA dehydrogenase [Sphingobium lignivorans]|uniref:Alkylation response protein AidB-like acyl-CoA dehydrogenase n=1 Tax=Sphingobium lignivorans TaxID=2735886 RepID=A0ABR6NB98_9SPHN|nr:acyl-CoA dehydrogenase [Sphingobium lignivorans]MBB5984557.1 alkylation response protein AidB-like acyl-CoA dehydrogenase [Sphingobium lignivorans]